MKKSILKLLLFAGLLFFPLMDCTAYAQEVYILTAEELQQWQKELDLQKSLITKQMQNENELQQALKLQKSQLIESKQALNYQQILLASSQQALTDANKRLTEYAKEEKLRRRKLKWQRNLAWVCFGVTAAIVIKDKIKD